jgi:precorrin-6x reductase
MSKITKKIMAFVGTEDASELVTALAEHTDNIYAAVSSEYGKAPHPGGNITLLSKYLDEEDMERWMERVNIDIVIDGTDISAASEGKIIKDVCEKRGVEYYRMAAKYQINMHTSVVRKDDVLLREMEYTVGNVLVEGDADLFRLLTGVRAYDEKMFPVVPAEPEMLKSVLDMGYKKENIISINRLIHADMLIALFNEFGISDYIFPGTLKEGMSERLAAVDRSNVKAAVYGDFVRDEGMNADDMWDMFAERFGIED